MPAGPLLEPDGWVGLGEFHEEIGVYDGIDAPGDQSKVGLPPP